LTLADKLLINDDFTTWAPLYTGEPFNFIHCDFPYGIDFNTGEYTSKVGNTILGDYDDSQKVYWRLLESLYENRHIIAPQAHIMFWFSQNLRRETEDFFTEMKGTVQPFLMIWHCGDGIVPDPQRYGRRTYETAMLVTFGDRKIVAPRALSIDGSRESSTRIHRSQKPLRVLEHFFEMFVDSSSHVLDPTCGSGTSLLAANNLKARRVIGLERDTGIYENAYTHINSASTVKL
jgi:DNA modification methylase